MPFFYTLKMNLYNKAITDARTFMNKEFSVPLVFVAPTNETANIKGLTAKHHIGFDSEGNMINSKTVKVTFSEQDLTTVGYPVRNANAEVDLKNHLVSVRDSTAVITQFKVSQFYPDERMGLITLILVDFI